MGNFIFILIIITVVLYLLSVFHRGKLDFAKFLLGSISLFFAMFLSLQDIVTPILAHMVADVTGLFGKVTNTFSSYADYGMLFIENNGETISLFIDYECAGFIEMTIFISLVAFFPVYDIVQKIYITVIGLFGIFMANVVRLCSICLIVYWFGNESFYFAHTILGRLIFYTISIGLYYYIFTKSQIKKQRIGSFSYVKDTNK